MLYCALALFRSWMEVGSKAKTYSNRKRPNVSSFNIVVPVNFLPRALHLIGLDTILLSEEAFNGLQTR